MNGRTTENFNEYCILLKKKKTILKSEWSFIALFQTRLADNKYPTILSIHYLWYTLIYATLHGQKLSLSL